MADDGDDDVLPFLSPKSKGPSVKQLRELSEQNQWLQAHIDWNALGALAFIRTKDPVRGNEVVQELYHKMLRWPLKELQKLKEPQAYATRAIINRAQNSRRWFRRVAVARDPYDPYAQLPSHTPTPERVVESRQEVRQLLAKLPTEWRIPYVLTEYYGFSIEEVAGYLSLTVDAVKKRKVNALKLLQILLNIIPPDSIVDRAKKLVQRK